MTAAKKTKVSVPPDAAAAGDQKKRAAEAGNRGCPAAEGGDANKRIKPGTHGDLVPINGLPIALDASLPVNLAASQGGQQQHRH